MIDSAKGELRTFLSLGDKLVSVLHTAQHSPSSNAKSHSNSDTIVFCDEIFFTCPIYFPPSRYSDFSAIT
jgi:hypothetical protein